MRKHNFSAGPAALPEPVINRIKEELGDWHNIGSSVMEISHRSSSFLQLVEEVFAKLRRLLQVPDTHQLLFMPGGATAQFSALPLNFGEGGAYFISGHWARKAAMVAKKVGDIQIVYDCGEKPTQLPKPSKWNVSSTAAYFHYCHNETVDGISFPAVPDISSIPVIADLSSCIASQPMDISKLGLGYACAQKNLGIAGITLIIADKELLQKSRSTIPLLNYQAQWEAGSLLNTPDTFAIYVCGLVCDWLEEQGGVTAMGEINQRKAQSLYETIDSSDGFYQAGAARAYRSVTNVVFNMQDEEKEKLFVAEATKNGLLYLKGHRARGGLRASIYNAVSERAVNDLCDFMQDFVRRYG